MIHKDYDNRKVRIPESTATHTSPAAGKVGVLTYAGWDDWYYVHVDGAYYARAQAHEVERNLLPVGA